MQAYKFRLYPNKKQIENLERNLRLCRFTYNKLLEKLKNQTKINKSEIQHHIVELKSQFPDLRQIYSKTLQYESYRLFSNLRALAQLKKKGKKVGSLRFKGQDWFKTINYNQSGFKLISSPTRLQKLHLSKIGSINIRCHRILEGKIKQITLKKEADKWYAILITDTVKTDLKCGDNQVGIDLGTIAFITDNNGNKVEAPLFFKQQLQKIRRAYQSISRKKKGSSNRQKAKLKLQKLSQKITNQRNDFLHKLSTELVKQNKLICLETLNIRHMTRKENFYNKRNILDSSWGKFISILKCKAESAGTQIIEVEPKNTTKECSNCGEIKDMKLWHRVYQCEFCGLEMDRDTNAAKNILAKGLGFVEKNKDSSMTQEAPTLSFG